MKQRLTYYLILNILLLQSVYSQVLQENTKVNLQLDEGIELVCYQSNTDVNSYYYLPVNMHFSIAKTGGKEYSLLVYKDENQIIKGGIMHWLLTWGIKKEQKLKAEALLRLKTGKETKLMGAVLAERSTSNNFEIQGNSKLSKLLNKTMVNKGNTPLIPNSKIAIAFNFSKDQATSINSLFENKNELKQTYVSMHVLVSFIKTNGKIYKKNITIKQNLQTLIKN